MELAAQPVDVQLEAFIATVLQNPAVAGVLERLPALGVPDCWLAAGCLFQTVWNVLTHRDPGHGIRDYDVDYCDLADLSWAGEDAVIARGRAVFAELGVEVEIRNEARVHLWYGQKFGVPCAPLRSTAAAVDTFPNVSSCVAMRPRDTGGWEVYAPFGFHDLFAMVARPNPVLAPESVYLAKTARWQQVWPELRVMAWDQSVR